MLALAVWGAGPDPARAEPGPSPTHRVYHGPRDVVPSPRGGPRADADSPDPVVPPRVLRIPAFTVRGTALVQPWVRATAFVEWYRQNYDPEASDDGFVALVGRLNVGANARIAPRWALATTLRLDGQKIWFPSGRDCGETQTCVPVEDDVRLERVTVRLDGPHFGVTGGDFNVQFGRGLGLSVRKIDEIGVDATIKGGRLDLRFPELRFTGFAGLTNRQNSDFATRRRLPDPGYPARSYVFAPGVGAGACDVSDALDPEIGNPLWTTCSDFLAGGRIEGQIPGRVDLGIHYTYLDFGDALIAPTQSTVFTEYLHQVGADVARSRIAGVWDAFVGAGVVVRDPNLIGTPFASERYTGAALYTSNTLYFDTTTVLIEGKHYVDDLVALTQNALLQYTENPTLEREDQQVPGNLNATGGRVRIDHTWRSSGLTLFFNSLEYVFAENLGQSQFRKDEGRLATHNYLGAIWRRPDSDLVVQVSGGYRYERFLSAGSRGDPLRRRFPHGEFYVSIPLGRTRALVHGLTVQGEGRWENIRFGATEDFFRGAVVVGYGLSPYFSISYVQGIDTELPTPSGEPSITDEVCSGATGSTCRPHLWPAVQVQINLVGSSFLRLFAGRQVGGRVCVNGSCRTLPDFEGIRSELVLSF